MMKYCYLPTETEDQQGSSGLRRSNSEGNLSMSVADAAKEQKVRIFVL